MAPNLEHVPAPDPTAKLGGPKARFAPESNSVHSAQSQQITMPEPRHEDPASSQKPTQERPQQKQQQHQRSNPLLRWTPVTLPPPVFLVPLLLLLLAAFYNLLPSSSPPPVQQSCESSQHLPPVQAVSYTPPSSTPPEPVAMASTEQTFIAIKPDGVQRGLIGPIITRFESRGFKLVAIKLTTPGKEHLEAHYADLKGKPFFNGLIEYMNSGPICAMIWEGRDAVKTGRTILGATNPLASAPGTIRGDYAIDVGRNVCHGSDSVENAKKEIALWFKDGEAVNWKSAQFDWVYEKA
ncbi:Nucleoside diphosphate kinase [Trichoderma ghanense]|uniref:Nucleoside diphosphate kinase n=1 Tax=Trichoderma ghanense TaxID=65468 RepID=A0ABY2H8I7_9HYPO